MSKSRDNFPDDAVFLLERQASKATARGAGDPQETRSNSRDSSDYNNTVSQLVRVTQVRLLPGKNKRAALGNMKP